MTLWCGYCWKKGADVNIKDNMGLKPLIAAAQKGHEVVVQLLQEKGEEKGEEKRASGRWIAWRRRLKKVI
jgi:hypothetical protein